MKLSKIFWGGAVTAIFAFVFAIATPLAQAQTGVGFRDGLRDVEANTGNIGFSQEDNLARIIVKVLEWAMYILAFVAVGAFVVSGFMFIFSGGQERADLARKILTYAIIGLVVALLGWVIIRTVADTLAVG